MPTDVKLNAEWVDWQAVSAAVGVWRNSQYGPRSMKSLEQSMAEAILEYLARARPALDNSKPTPAVGDDGLPTTQRWRTTGKVGDEFVHDADPKGGWVLWTDHVAALAAAHSQQ